jgi:hypothetical protein
LAILRDQECAFWHLARFILAPNTASFQTELGLVAWDSLYCPAELLVLLRVDSQQAATPLRNWRPVPFCLRPMPTRTYSKLVLEAWTSAALEAFLTWTSQFSYPHPVYDVLGSAQQSPVAPFLLCNVSSSSVLD